MTEHAASLSRPASAGVAALRSARDLAMLSRAAGLAWRAARDGVAACAQGVTTGQVAESVRATIVRGGGRPAFEGYQPPGAPRPFPSVACIAVGEEVVHAPPGERVLRAGDLVTVDAGVELDGWYGDVAESVLLPGADPSAATLLAAGRRAVAAGIRACTAGSWWSGVARAIRAAAARDGFVVVPRYAGHGIGRALHEPPRADCQLRAGDSADFLLLPGLVITIEPIVVSPPGTVGRADDGWTVRTADGTPACHVERMVAVTRTGPRVLGVRERWLAGLVGL